MMKKVISVLLMLMILSTFTACGQKGSTAGKESEAASESTVKAAEQ